MLRTRLRTAILATMALALPLLPGCGAFDREEVPISTAPMSVVERQTALQQLGYYLIPVDGIVGRYTRSAIYGFELDNGLPFTGTSSPATDYALRVAVAELALGGKTGPQTIYPAAAAGDISGALPILAAVFPDYTYRTADLNADGRTDVIGQAAPGSAQCEGVLCPQLVLVNRGAEFEVVNDDIRAVTLDPLPGATAGYHDLGATGTGGTAYTLAWDGETYR